LIGFLLFLCLAIFTAMVIPSGDNLHSNSSRSRSSATAMDYYYIHGDLMVMSNMTRVLRHEALAAAACLLLHDPADLSQHEQIPTSCPTNTSSYYSSFSHLHNVHQQRQHAIRVLCYLITTTTAPSVPKYKIFWLDVTYTNTTYIDMINIPYI
jgi:adiponectin receptor